VRLNPSDYRNHLTLADAEMANHRWRDAQAAADRAVTLAPDASEGYNAQGLVALSLNRLDEAAAKFRLALARDPQNAQAMNNLGVALLRAGRRNQAIHYFAEASRIDPRFTTPRRNAVRAAKALSLPMAVLIFSLLAIQWLPTGIGAGFAFGLLVVLAVLVARRVRKVGWRVALTNRGPLFSLLTRTTAPSPGDPQASKELVRQLRREKAPPRPRSRRGG
jgi:tetratricopeptide (TPR) repeat protein